MQQLDVILDPLEPLEALGGRAPDGAKDLVALFEEKLGEVTAVLPGDSGD